MVDNELESAKSELTRKSGPTEQATQRHLAENTMEARPYHDEHTHTRARTHAHTLFLSRSLSSLSLSLSLSLLSIPRLRRDAECSKTEINTKQTAFLRARSPVNASLLEERTSCGGTDKSRAFILSFVSANANNFQVSEYKPRILPSGDRMSSGRTSELGKLDAGNARLVVAVVRD